MFWINMVRSKELSCLHSLGTYVMCLFFFSVFISHIIQSTLVISKSKGIYETLQDIRTSTYQICGTEENN